MQARQDSKSLATYFIILSVESAAIYRIASCQLTNHLRNECKL
jgi:hypothetical protein